MREIVTVEQVDRLFLVLAVAVPLIALALGALWGARSGAAGRGAVRGLGIGLLGPANLLLWHVYNALTNRMGLDTVKNLLVQLLLFVALGAAAGLAAGWFSRRRPQDAGPELAAEGARIGPRPTANAGAARTLADADEEPRDA